MGGAIVDLCPKEQGWGGLPVSPMCSVNVIARLTIMKMCLLYSVAIKLKSYSDI